MKHYLPVLISIFLLGGCAKKNDPNPGPNTANVTAIVALPSVLKESSGLEIAPDGTFWSHNDHGGQDDLYAFDEQGQLLRTLNIQNATNEDWEDLAFDQTGNLYIGDFGNNANDRQDQVIYKIQDPSPNSSNAAAAQAIHFTLEDQTAFPPPKPGWFFDVEAFFALGDSLYLLTKDRSSPYTGKTKMYRLPNQAGTFTAIAMREFVTDPNNGKGSITSVDISPDGAQVAMLSNEVVWVFSDFQGRDFFAGKVKRYDLPMKRQMEGLVFRDSCTIFLINEMNLGEPGMLYKMTLCE